MRVVQPDVFTLQQVSLHQWDEDRKITAVVYNHSRTKLVVGKAKVRRSKQLAFLSSFRHKKSSQRLQCTESTPKEAVIPRKSRCKDGKESSSKFKPKLQIFVRIPLSPKTLCLQLDPETSVSSLKKLIQDKTGIDPKHQRLYIRKNFELCGPLSLEDLGIERDENIQLRFPVGLMGGGPKAEKHPTDDKFLRDISSRTGTSWQGLAGSLGLEESEIEEFQAKDIENPNEQSYKMLAAWWGKQTDHGEAAQRLKDALNGMGHADLAILVPGERTSTEKSKGGTPSQCAANACEEALKGQYTGSYAKMLPWMDDDDRKRVGDIMTKLKLLENRNIKGNVYDDIFLLKTREGHPFIRAICIGMPNNEKFTLGDRIAYDWADGKSKVLQKYKLLLALKIHALEQYSDLTDAVFDQLLAQDTVINRSDLKSYVDNNQDKVLVLLDGLDEFMTTDLGESKVGSILNILNRKIGTEISVLITTRPSYCVRSEISLTESPIPKVVELGFSEEDVKLYIRRFFRRESDKADGLVERIRSSEDLSDLAKSPVLLSLMCSIWREDSALPDTMSRLYSNALKYIFKPKTATEVSNILVSIGKVALDGLFSPEKRFSFQETEFEKNTLDAALKAGILTSQKVMKGFDTHYNVHFVHGTFQEFSVAKYCQHLLKKDPEEFQKVLDQITDPWNRGYFLAFCCGDNEQCSNAILEMLHMSERKVILKSVFLKLFLLCFFESQSEHLPSVGIINFILSDTLYIANFSCDQLTSMHYFLKRLTTQSDGKGDSHLAKLRCINISYCQSNLWKLGDSLLQFKTIANARELTVSFYKIESDLEERMASSVGVPGKLEGSYQVWSSLQELQQLETLNIVGCKLRDEDMKRIAGALENMPNLRKLTFQSCKLTGKGLKYIAKTLGNMPNLVELSFNDNETLGGSFSLLKLMKHLQVLNLRSCNLTCEDFKHIAKLLTCMPNLVELELSNNKTLSGSFSHLKEARHLKKLSLVGCGLTGKDLKHIAKSLRSMPSLAELDLSNNSTLRGLFSPLENVNQLEKLHLFGCELRGKDLEHIAESHMPSLVELDLSRNCTLSGSFLHLKKMKQLQKLSLNFCKLTGEDMKHIAESLSELPELVELDFYENGTLRGSFSHLKDMKFLQKLSLQSCKLTGEDLNHIAESLTSLPNFVELDLSRNWTLVGSFCLLKEMEHLQKLSLKFCKLTGEDMKHIADSLSQLPNLVELDLSHNHVLGSTLSYLKEMKHLQKLSLWSCRLTGKNVEHIVELLKSLPNLLNWIFLTIRVLGPCMQTLHLIQLY